MPVQIRDSVFETNSSSTHSVTLAKDEIVDFGLSVETLRAGVITVRPRSYGWEWARYYSLEGKLAYLVTQLAVRALEESEADVDVAAELRRGSEKVDRLLQWVEDITGCKVEVISPPEDKYLRIYVDHDSHGVGYEVLQDREACLSFLFSKTSYIQTGNSNERPGEKILADTGVELYDTVHHGGIPHEHPEFVTVTFSTAGYDSDLEIKFNDFAGEFVATGYFATNAVEDLLHAGVIVGASVQFGEGEDVVPVDSDFGRHAIFNRLRSMGHEHPIKLVDDLLVNASKSASIPGWKRLQELPVKIDLQVAYEPGRPAEIRNAAIPLIERAQELEARFAAR